MQWSVQAAVDALFKDKHYALVLASCKILRNMAAEPFVSVRVPGVVARVIGVDEGVHFLGNSPIANSQQPHQYTRASENMQMNNFLASSGAIANLLRLVDRVRSVHQLLWSGLVSV